MKQEPDLLEIVKHQVEQGIPLDLEQTQALLMQIEMLKEQWRNFLPRTRRSATTEELLSLWRHNVREFYERQQDGWRAIVSSDTEDTTWTAYVERGEVRIYASPTFPFLQDALHWGEEQIQTQNELLQQEGL
ncbi:MAG: hypothetical protein HC911_08730 [Chloroflexaceae bacterium]|nr:hypothetical protein [Chloroflexaceae bacterium]